MWCVVSTYSGFRPEPPAHLTTGTSVVRLNYLCACCIILGVRVKNIILCCLRAVFATLTAIHNPLDSPICTACTLNNTGKGLAETCHPFMSLQAFQLAAVRSRLYFVALLYVGLAMWLGAAASCCAFFSTQTRLFAGTTYRQSQYPSPSLHRRDISTRYKVRFLRYIDGSSHDTQRNRHMRQDCEDRVGFGRGVLHFQERHKSLQQDTQLPHRALASCKRSMRAA